MRVIVTGSKGFIGSILIPKLKQSGYNVIELDICDGIDITDWDQIKMNSHFECVIHLACLTYVPDSYKIPKDFYRINVLGTLNMLELCRLHNAKMIFVSSYVYGVPNYLPVDEEHPVKAFNPYAETKLIGEQLCKGYNRDFNVPITILRPFNIFGKEQNERFLIPSIIKQASSGTILLKDPRPKRDFIYIDDFIKIFINVLQLNSNNVEIFNVGSGKSYSIEDIVRMVKLEYKKEINVEFSGETRKLEILDTRANITKASKLLGWEPIYDLSDGIKEILK